MVPITELNNGDLKLAPTHQAPQGWRAWLGENMGLGMMAAAAATQIFSLFNPAVTLSLWTMFGAMGAGAVAGGFFDKLKNERQAEEGVIIDKPSFFNRGVLSDGIFKGGLHGLVLAVAAMKFLGSFVPFLSIAGLGAIAPVLPFAIAGIAAAVGAVAGSISRKEKMEETYKQVETAYLVQTGRLAGKSRGMGVAPAVAAGVGAGIGLTAAGKAKVAAIDPGMVGTAAGAAMGINMEAESVKVAANPYDFSNLEEHPANAARRSFVQAEQERRAALGQEGPALS